MEVNVQLQVSASTALWHVIFEFFTVVGMKNVIICYLTPCDRLRTVLQLLVTANVVLSSLILSFLMMETICSSETSYLTRDTRRHIPEDGILHRRLVRWVESCDPHCYTTAVEEREVLSLLRIQKSIVQRSSYTYWDNRVCSSFQSWRLGFELGASNTGWTEQHWSSFSCHCFVPLTAPQSSPSIILGRYDRLTNGCSNIELGPTPIP
jgi:hypothetical protein